MTDDDRIEYEWIEYAQFRCTDCGRGWHIWGSEANLEEQRTAANSHVCPERPQNAT